METDLNVFVYVHRQTFGRDNVVEASLPYRATDGAAAFDVKAYLASKRTVEIEPLQTVRIPTGLFMALPPGMTMLVCPRSGLACKGITVTNAPGIVDSDYRDEVQVILTYLAPMTAPSYVIRHGDRIAQFLFLNEYGLAIPSFQQVAGPSLLPVANSNRVGGFGSTGV